MAREMFVFAVLVVIGSACAKSETDSPKCDAGDVDSSVTEDVDTNDASTDEGEDIDASVDEHEDPDPDASAPVTCEGSDVAELCKQFCEGFCQNQELLCVESECLPDDCDEGGAVYESCASRCTTADCARDLCEEQQGAQCESFGIEASGMFESLCLGRDPSCVLAPDFGCTDVCGSTEQVGGDFVNNGVCEDGGGEDSESSMCTRGSDCTDCGPRVCALAGGDCLSHGDCCGFYTVGALCVDPDGESGVQASSCFPVCNATNPCPEGFRCIPTSGGMDVCVQE